jgi:hypothetical protein
METIEFLRKIPYLLKAKEAELESDELQNAYEREKAGLTNVYARGKNRFYPIKRLKTPFYMWRKKRHILSMLDFMDKNHKVQNLSQSEKISLDRQATRIKKKSYSDIDNTVMYSRW